MTYRAKEMEDDIIIIIILIVLPCHKFRKGSPYEWWRIALSPDILKTDTSQRLPLCPRDSFAVMDVSSFSIYGFVRSVFSIRIGNQHHMIWKERIPDE